MGIDLGAGLKTVARAMGMFRSATGAKATPAETASAAAATRILSAHRAPRSEGRRLSASQPHDPGQGHAVGQHFDEANAIAHASRTGYTQMLEGMRHVDAAALQILGKFGVEAQLVADVEQHAPAVVSLLFRDHVLRRFLDE